MFFHQRLQENVHLPDNEQYNRKITENYCKTFTTSERLIQLTDT